MKNLIAELLVRLAEKEEESKELVAQVEALEIVVTALLRKLDGEQLQQMNTHISEAIQTTSTAMAPDYTKDVSLLESYIHRLIHHPRQ